jgi:hypothetical protein
MITICLFIVMYNITKVINNSHFAIVYDLADMKLKTATKRIERGDKHLRRYNQNNFSVSKLQLCFTRGANSIK